VGCVAKSKPALYLYVLVIGYFLSRASKIRLLVLSVKLYCNEGLIYFAWFKSSGQKKAEIFSYFRNLNGGLFVKTN
jgi:hypothetical protein